MLSVAENTLVNMLTFTKENTTLHVARDHFQLVTLTTDDKSIATINKYRCRFVYIFSIIQSRAKRRLTTGLTKLEANLKVFMTIDGIYEPSQAWKTTGTRLPSTGGADNLTKCSPSTMFASKCCRRPSVNFLQWNSEEIWNLDKGNSSLVWIQFQTVPHRKPSQAWYGRSKF